jgi:hypothetical protein
MSKSLKRHYTNMSNLNSPPPQISFATSSAIPNSANNYSSANNYLHYFHLPMPFPHILTLPLVLVLWTGLVLTSYALIL